MARFPFGSGFQPPVAGDAVFDHLKTGDLWNENARYIDDWYGIEKIDDQTFIIGEPKSSQYNSSYLIVGNKEAILFDTGAGERGSDIQPISELVQKYTDKQIRVVLSHFHFDHTGGIDEFDGVTMIDLPHIRARIKDGEYKVSALENVHIQRPLLGVKGWVKPNETIDLGDRKIQFVNTTGHTPEAITLIDHQRKYAFTGDFMYKHLGGILIFAPGSDHDEYIESIEKMVEMTGDDYRYFGAHGLPEYNRSWLEDVGAELVKIKNGEVKLSFSASSVVPWVPLRLHAKGQMLIYFTPFLTPAGIFSFPFSISLISLFSIVLVLLSLLIK